MRDLKWFNSLSKRDFENGAVLNEIAEVFKIASEKGNLDNSSASPVQQLKDSISNLAIMRDSTKVGMSKTEVAGMKVAFNAVIAKLESI